MDHHCPGCGVDLRWHRPARITIEAEGRPLRTARKSCPRCGIELERRRNPILDWTALICPLFVALGLLGRWPALSVVVTIANVALSAILGGTWLVWTVARWRMPLYRPRPIASSPAEPGPWA